MLSQVRESKRMLLGTHGTEVHEDLKPLENEAIVVKHRVSAFTETDLQTLLRAQSIENLILCGIATSGVVLSTLRFAADLDYNITVVSDACADGDDETHRLLVEKVFPRQAAVVTTEELVGNKSGT